MVETREITPVAGIPFPVASRSQRRMSNVQTVSNLAGSTTFQPIPLTATGFVRKVSLYFTAAYTTSASAAIVTGDSPWNVISGISISDATGQPIMQPISGYSLYLVNKYLPSGYIKTNTPNPWSNPHMSPEYAFAASGTAGAATFRLDLDFEQDPNTGMGCIPNLDSNASLQLKIDVGASSLLWSGGTASAATVSVRVEQHYWAPVAATLGGQAVMDKPVGFGDFLETRYETGTASASAENTLQVTARGGLVKGYILVSRAAGVRTALTAASNVGLVVDNNAVDEGITLESHKDLMRRTYGYYGTDLTTTYAPLTAGVMPGLDSGVLVWPFFALSGGRDSWLNTRVGSLVQLKVTPGSSATQYEIISQIMQVKDPDAFYAASARD
jgi:hypothetical protein